MDKEITCVSTRNVNSEPPASWLPWRGVRGAKARNLRGAARGPGLRPKGGGEVSLLVPSELGQPRAQGGQGLPAEVQGRVRHWPNVHLLWELHRLREHQKQLPCHRRIRSWRPSIRACNGEAAPTWRRRLPSRNCPSRGCWCFTSGIVFNWARSRRTESCLLVVVQQKLKHGSSLPRKKRRVLASSVHRSALACNLFGKLMIYEKSWVFMWVCTCPVRTATGHMLPWACRGQGLQSKVSTPATQAMPRSRHGMVWQRAGVRGVRRWWPLATPQRGVRKRRQAGATRLTRTPSDVAIQGGVQHGRFHPGS